MNGTFTDEDLKKLAEFSSVLLKHVKWDGIGTKELMKVYGLLMWYNSLDQKIKDNILEVRSEGSLDDDLDNQIESGNADSDSE